MVLSRSLSKQIKDELEDFVKHLKTIKVDVQLANRALVTPEKEELQRIQMHKEMEKQ